ncbi:MAG: WecB/TagA/CpsF family glycosyltransferase [Chthoniobacteraceae bacterium]|nr:WecB/TagA/CpsF family glycosyltransferase [Chthoniobacteraceae bacterium]
MSSPVPDFPFCRILGIPFFNGPAREAVAIALRGGLVVVPSAPVLRAMAQDPFTREALLHSDLAITDSGLMVLLWRWLTRERLERVSGLEYLKLLLDEPALREPGTLFWVMPSIATMEKTLRWLNARGFAITREDCYIAPRYGPGRVGDAELLERINARRPAHVIMAIGGGVQEKLAYFLKEGAAYRPSIHCTGGAIGFLTGDQVRIPAWADYLYLGWLFRCLHRPGEFIPRYWKARKLVPLLLKYRDRPPGPPAS